MNVFSRGVRNAFRNGIRAGAIIGMLGLSIGLALSMLLAHKAVGQRIASVQGSVGNVITVAPAGIRGFNGGGNPLTTDDLANVSKAAHVTSIDMALNDRLAGDDTNLVPAIDAGSFGQRQFRIERGSDSGGAVEFHSDGAAPADVSSFKLPIIVLGASNPLNADSAATGGSLKLTSGKSFDGTKDATVALVGKSLAEKNNLSVGSTFTGYSGTTITVSGIFDTGNTFSNNQIVMPLPTVQRLSQQTKAVTAATVHIDSATNLDRATSDVKTILGDKADVSNQADSVKTTLDSLHSIQTVSLFSLIGATVSGAVIILLTMIMIVRERRREIGVLKAIGGSNVRVISQFGIEALTLTVLGAVIGIIIGSLGATPVTKMLINNKQAETTNSDTFSSGPVGGGSGPVMIRSTGGGPRGFAARFDKNSAVQGLRNLKANVDGSVLLYGLGGALIVAAIGSMAAAALIAKVRPADVMRAE